MAALSLRASNPDATRGGGNRDVAAVDPADLNNARSLLIEENVVERLQEMGIEMIGRPALSWLGVPLMVGDRVLGVMARRSISGVILNSVLSVVSTITAFAPASFTISG
mgnify:CR=1 FL=1